MSAWDEDEFRRRTEFAEAQADQKAETATALENLRHENRLAELGPMFEDFKRRTELTSEIAGRDAMAATAAEDTAKLAALLGDSAARTHELRRMVMAAYLLKAEDERRDSITRGQADQAHRHATARADQAHRHELEKMAFADLLEKGRQKGGDLAEMAAELLRQGDALKR